MVLALIISLGLQQALQNLDRTLADETAIDARKEIYIDSLRQRVRRASTDRERYTVLDELFSEYYKWNPDSAFSYARRKLSLARTLADAELSTDAAIDLAWRFIISGLYHDALDALGEVKNQDLPAVDNALYEVYHSLLQESERDVTLYREYQEKEAYFFQRCIASLTPDMSAYYAINTNQFIQAGEFEEALRMLEKRLSSASLPARETSIIQYWIARVYQAKGDAENAMIHYAYGAQEDLSLSIKEHAALYRLAIYCFQRGDLKRAYRYVVRSYSDAVDVDAKYRQAQIAGTLPIIVQAYDSLESQQRRRLTAMVVILAIVLCLLAVSFQQIRIGYRRIQEANRIKETYLGEFLAMFSEHIGSLERYRSNLRVTAKQNDFDILLQELRSDEFIDSEWAFLMDKFDKTFLGLFPDFIPQLNTLLRPEEQIGADLPKKSLTNQLRVYALIRLGILKSSRIAKFLRLSNSTVYNFRVHLRNAAMGKRKDIELKLMKLGD